MKISPETSHLVEEVQVLSNQHLHNAADLAVLLEIAKSRQQELDELSFLSKFLTKTFVVMTRIGKSGEGYEKLSQEFTENLEKATLLLRAIVNKAPDEVRRRFTSEYFTFSPDALNHFMDLLSDLSWYKNWQIDRRSAS
jgi:aminoglycoside/choline kinase family phosphotransferase